MKVINRLLIILTISILAGCDSTDFTSTWINPTARNIDLRGEVAAFLLSGNEAVRRSFETHLAQELNKNRIETVAGYELLPDTDAAEKQEVLADLKQTEADYAIFMRVTDERQEVTYVPGSSWYGGAYNDPYFWYNGSYYGPAGFGGAWPPFYDPGYFYTDTIVSVETLVYSVPDSELIWAGQSRTMNPSEVDDFVEDLAGETLKEFEKAGFVRLPSD